MNNVMNQYPAALYSAVTEVGYRGEQFTGEVLRSGGARRAAHRRARFSWLRMPAFGSGEGAPAGRRQSRPAHHAHAR